MIRVLSPGLLTTVQDEGRWGQQHHGVPVAGAMDPFAYRRANRLVGNVDAAASLEVTLTGPRLQIGRETIVACCGGEVDLQVDGTVRGGEGPHVVPAGAELAIGRLRRGARAYLAVAGGIDVPPVLGSRSTHLPSAMGGLDGRALRRGDVLAVGVDTRVGGPVGPSGPVLPLPAVVLPGESTVLRVLPGPEQDAFPGVAWRMLLDAEFVLHPDSNRMGYRLTGPALPAPVADRPSSAVTMGTIQVPGGGHPIVLMADRQTTGGYPRLACVIAADLGVAGQLKPGDRVHFGVCTPAEAQAALLSRTSVR